MRLLPVRLLLAVFVPSLALAQGGALSGRVTDKAGAPLPGVHVTVRGSTLLFARTVLTSTAGGYRVGGLPAGVFELTFEHDGFERVEWRDLRVGAGLRLTLDAELQPGTAPGQGLAGQGAAPGAGTRAASDRFRGRVWGTVTGHRFQANNLTPQLAAEGAGFGNPVRRVSEVGFDAGVPLLPGKAWLAAAADRTDANVGIIGFYRRECLGGDGGPVPGASLRVECLHSDITRLDHVSARLIYQWSPSHRTTLVWGRSETRKPTRGASASVRWEHTNRQSDLGRAQPFQVEHHGLVSGRLALDARYTFSDASFILDFQEPGLASVQGAYDRYTLVQWRSGVRTEHRRPTSRFVVTGRLAWQGAAPARHETSAGFDITDRSSTRIDRTGGAAVSVFDGRSGFRLPYQARIVRDGETSHWERQYSVFLEESYARGRLAIDAGLRFEVQDDRARPASVPANPLLPDLLPAVRSPGADSGVVYRDLAPRVAVRWEPDARTALRAVFVRSHSVGNTTSAPLQPTGQTRLVYWWNDADGDGLVRREELDFARGLAATPSANYDPERPWSVRTPATVDPRLRSVITDELTAGLEHRLTRRLSLRASVLSRRIHRLQAAYRIEDDGSPVGSGTFYPISWAPPSCPAGAACPAVTFYERAHRLPSRTRLRNDGRYGRHEAVDLVLHKRQAQGWMFDASVRWSRARWFFPQPTRDYTDPTNIAMRDGTQYSMAGPRWTATLRASARLPWRLEAAAVFTARDGMPYARVVASPNRGALGSAGVLTARYGSERYPRVMSLDCRLERQFAAGRLVLVPSLNVFNAANAGTVLGRNATQNSQSANAVERILPPRSIRLDFRASW